MSDLQAGRVGHQTDAALAALAGPRPILTWHNQVTALPLGTVLTPTSPSARARLGSLTKVMFGAFAMWRSEKKPDVYLYEAEVLEYLPLEVTGTPVPLDPLPDPEAELADWLQRCVLDDADLARRAGVKQGDPKWQAYPIALTLPRAFRVRSWQDARPVALVEDVAGDDDADVTGILDGAAAAEHIARHCPAMVLEDCAAKLRVVAEWRAARLAGQDTTVLHRVLRVLTWRYADRPGYREEWAG